MKRGKFYSDLDEFWVVGDLIAKTFMGWGGECIQCYVDFGDPSKAERFSTYKEALKYTRSDEDAAKWVEDHGGSRFAKPLRCRKSVVVYHQGARP